MMESQILQPGFENETSEARISDNQSLMANRANHRRMPRGFKNFPSTSSSNQGTGTSHSHPLRNNFDSSMNRKNRNNRFREKQNLQTPNRSNVATRNSGNQSYRSNNEQSSPQKHIRNRLVPRLSNNHMPYANENIETKTDNAEDRSDNISQGTNQHKQSTSRRTDGHSCNQRGFDKLQESKNYECMICCDTIYNPQAIWSCTSCYNMFHLKCAKNWYEQSLRSHDDPLSTSNIVTSRHSTTNRNYYNNHKNRSVTWSCPACRMEITERPSIYKCFCGKVVRPEPKKYLVAHSCGQTCGRKQPTCDHFCNNRCHPGHCDKCTLVSKKPCFCGKIEFDMNCATSQISCDSVCDRKKDCGKCRCEDKCHPGPCTPCDLQVELACYCGQKKNTVKCKDAKVDQFGNLISTTCNQPCPKTLSCLNHKCDKVCHEDPCPECKFTNKSIKTCPCGSTVLKRYLVDSRVSCLDTIPTCSRRCGRLLICGHKCESKCHNDSCPACPNKTTVKCNCGRTSKTINCSLMFKIENKGDEKGVITQQQYKYECTIKCQKMKNCKRHKCNTVCCEARTLENSPLHQCAAVCGKKLNCGKHFCQEICEHQFSCGDCPNLTWDPLNCHCGYTVVQPPITCTTKLPPCPQLCNRQHSCDHPVKHNCYSSIDENLDKVACAPCTYFVEKSCFCNSESKKTVYCYQPGYSCSKQCRRPLRGCDHLCDKICHNIDLQPCVEPNQVCKRACRNPRSTCGHPCNLPCHGSEKFCPKSDCNVVIERSCSCGHRVEKTVCHKLTQDASKSIKMLSIMNRGNNESFTVDINKHLKTDAKELECNDDCLKAKEVANQTSSQQEEMDKMSMALGYRDPIDILKEVVSFDYEYACLVFKKLCNLVKSAHQSDKRFVHLKMEPTNEIRRRITSDLSIHFGCSTMSFDEEPYRYVMIRAYRNRSCEPLSFKIEDLNPNQLI